MAGKTLAALVVGQFEKLIAPAGDTPLLSHYFGEHEPFVSLFSLLELELLNSATFRGMPKLGSSIVFELFSVSNNNSTTTTAFPSDSNHLFVRFHFQNGTDFNGLLQAYSLFGRGPSQLDMAWPDFLAAMTDIMTDQLTDWCRTCASASLFCWGMLDRDAADAASSHPARRRLARRRRRRRRSRCARRLQGRRQAGVRRRPQPAQARRRRRQAPREGRQLGAPPEGGGSAPAARRVRARPRRRRGCRQPARQLRLRRRRAGRRGAGQARRGRGPRLDAWLSLLLFFLTFVDSMMCWQRCSGWTRNVFIGAPWRPALQRYEGSRWRNRAFNVYSRFGVTYL